MRSSSASIGGAVDRSLLSKLSRSLPAACLFLLPVALAAQTAHYSGELGSIGSGLGHPYGVAVDASGNVYIADQNNNRILKETPANGVYTQTVIATGFSYIRSVAVDTSGNVYAAQIGTPAAVYKLTLSGSTYTQSSIGTGFGAPYSLAVDAGGDVFVADSGLTGVIKLTPSGNSYIQTTIDNTLPEPYGVAVDASGNLYIADNAHGLIYKETLTGNSYARTTVASPSGAFDVGVDGSGNLYVTDESDSLVYKETLSAGTYTQSVLLGGLTNPIGIAVSATGNVYIANTYDDQVLGLTPEVNFGSANLSSTTGAVSIAFTFASGGTGVAEAVSTQGAPGLDFSDAHTGTCYTNTTSHTYAMGDVCTVDVTFTPTLSGVRYGAAVLKNSSGVPIATGYVSGNGTGPMVSFTPYTQSTVTSSVPNAEGMAVDGSGNLFVATGSSVYELTYSAGSYSAPVQLFTGAFSIPFSSLQWIAVDGAANLYLADGGSNNRIVKETPSNGSYTASLPCSSACQGNEIAVDGSGNLYTLSAALNEVVKLTLESGGTYSAPTTISTRTGNNPWSVVLDASGNVFYSDQGNGCLYKLTPSGSSYTESQIDCTMNSPQGMAIDPAGNLYLTQTGGEVVEYKLSSGTYTKVSTPVITGLSNSTGLWFDQRGNLLVSNTGTGQVLKLDYVDAPALSFASTIVGSTSSDSPRTVALTNNGNAALGFPVPTSGANPTVPANFTLNSSGGSACPLVPSAGAPGTLPAGDSCTLPIAFAPAATGSLTGSLVLTDTSLNAAGPGYATQSILLSGTGLPLTPTTTTLTLAPTPPVAGGTVTLIATVAPAPTGSPLGSVTFLNNGVAYPATVSLDANGVAAYSISALAAGSDSWTAAYAGNAGSAASTSSPIALTVASSVVTATTLAIAPGVSVNDGSDVTLTATVESSSLPVYPGAALFCDATAARCDGAALFGSAQLTSSGVAIFKFIPGAGTYRIKAVYAGAGSSSAGASSSAAQTLTVNPFVLYQTGTTLVATGLPGNYTLSGVVDGFGIVPPTGAVTFQNVTNITTPTTLGVEPLAPLPLGRLFSQSTGVPTSQAAWEATGDFNGDGIPDVVVVNNSYNGTVTVLIGTGNGTFFSNNPPIYAVGNIPEFVTVADLNHDGFLDIVVANTFSGTVEVLLGTGTGTFGAGATFAVGSHPDFIAVGDLNGDGIPDLAVTNTADSTVSVLLGNGDGTFRAQTTYAAGAAAGVVIGDFNHDGIADLAVTNPDTVDPVAQAQSTISLFLGVGDGTFPAARTLALPIGTLPSAPIAADLRRNGTLDLLFGDSQASSAYVMLGNNDGTFAAIATYPIESASTSVAVGDINRDGILDMVVADTGPDIAGKYFSILLGVGDGTFGPRTDYGIPNVQGPAVAVLADFNGDGLLDISTADATSSDSSIFLQLQTTTATLTGVSVPGPSVNYAKATYAGDASHLTSYSRQASLLPLPSTMVLAGSPNPSLPSAAVTLEATLTGASGVPTGVVSFYSGTTLLGTGTLNGSGVATYTLSSALTARSSFSATYPGNGVYAGSQATLLEYVGAATAIALSVSSPTITAGAPLTLTGTVTPNPGSTPPAAGQVVFNYQQTVNGTVRTGTLGPVAVNNLGAALFKFSPGAGSYTVTAAFGGTATDTPSTSAPQTVTVTAAAIFGSLTTLTPTTVGPNDYTLLATVTAFGQIPATGLVSFSSDTNTLLGSASLVPTTLSHSLAQAAGSPISIPGGANPTFVTVGDVNGDGIPDLLTALSGDTNHIAVQLGIGNGGFAAAALLAVPGRPNSIALADLNGDGKPDIIVAEGLGAYVLLGHGDGTFAAPTFAGGTQGNPYFVAAADLNGDGIIDLAIACSNGPVVLLGKGDGTFQAPVVYTGGTGRSGLAIADLNGDGFPDLVVANQAAGSLSLFLGVGDGTFKAPTTKYVPGQNPLLITAADLRHIGTQDVIVTDSGTADAYVLLGNNNGTLQNAVLYAIGVTTSPGSSQILTGDLNNDGILDLAVADYGNAGNGALISILPGMGDGTFGPKTDYPAGVGVDSIALADLNGDGLLDIATANHSGSNTIYLQQQSETASLANVSLNGAGNHNVLASYGGDASRTASQSAAVVLTGLNQTTTTTTLSYAPNPAYVGQTVTFTANVLPIPTGVPLGTVAFYNGTALIGTGAVNAQGMATFALTNLPVGSGSAHAVYSGNALSTASTSATITVQVNSANTTATVTAVTSSNLAPTYGQSITLTATVTPAPTAAPPGGIKFYAGSTVLGTQVINAQGIATLSLSLPLGLNAITAVYSGSVGFAASTSSPLSISARAPSAIMFSASPTTQLATMPVVFTAQVNSATTGVQTGTVSFLNGSTVLATVTIVPGQPAVYTETGLASGAYSVTASYSGDGNFLPSASTGAPVSITVSDLDLALGGDKNKSVVPGGAVTYNFPLSPVVTSTFIYSVALTATGLPPGATYTFSPATIPAGSGTQPVAFTVQTAKSSALLQRTPGSRRTPWLALVLGLLLPLAGAKRVRARLITSAPQRASSRLLLLLLLCALGLGLVGGLGGCGSGGFLGAPKGPTSYTITINATSGTLVRTSTVQLNLE